MVNINSPKEQPGRAVGERGSNRPGARSRSHHMWGARLGRRREEERFREPTTLEDLEHLAHRTVTLMEKYAPPSPQNLQKAMDLLRQQHNMNFLMVCPKCHGSHMYDEITAPER